MDICIVYASVFGHGRQCVDELSTQLREKGHTVREYSIKETGADNLPTSDVYVFSAPTRAGSPMGKMKRYMKSFKPKKKDAKYTLISTGSDPGTGPLEKMAAIVDTHGLTRIGNGARITLKGLNGPLEEGYKDKLKAMAEEISQA